MILLIGGHQRSGTTLLRNLCDGHPEITITLESGFFIEFGTPYNRYQNRILKRWRELGSRPLDSSYAGRRWIPWRNLILILRYLSVVRKYRENLVDLKAIESGLRRIFPGSRIIGDKYPDYLYSIDKFSKVNELFSIIIYRDCLDVVSSCLKKVSTDWRQKSFSKKFDTAEKIAKRWVHAIELMEIHTERSYIIRYENLVQRPKQELKDLGEWLGVDPSYMPAEKIKNSNVGKYKKGLSKKEIETVISVAGKTMERYGYL